MRNLRLIIMAGAALLAVACAGTTPEKSGQRDRKVEGTDIVIWEPFLDQAEAHYVKRVIELEKRPKQEGGVLFVGDSITEGMAQFSLFPGIVSANYGVGWDTTRGLGERLAQITRNNPDRIFIMIGTNNYTYGHSSDGIYITTLAAIDVIHDQLPDTEIYLQSILPRGTEANILLQGVNARLAEIADKEAYTFLNLAPFFAGADGQLATQYTSDGLHLNAAGYALWESLIDICVRQGCAGLGGLYQD